MPSGICTAATGPFNAIPSPTTSPVNPSSPVNIVRSPVSGSTRNSREAAKSAAMILPSDAKSIARMPTKPSTGVVEKLLVLLSASRASTPGIPKSMTNIWPLTISIPWGLAKSLPSPPPFSGRVEDNTVRSPF